MYRLSNEFTRHRYAVTIVGCGGTGGFVAESLCRLLPGQVDLILVDHDRVEERNLSRQSFYREDLGKFKSETLAHRLSTRFGRSVGYSNLPVAMVGLASPGLVIGCVDNGLARRDIARAVSDMPYPDWWVDAGNGDDYGQIVIGNTDIMAEMLVIDDVYKGLPLPTIQKPELLAQAPKSRSCAEVAEEQGPTINLMMAAAVVEVVRRLIEGTCPWLQLYIDMKAGTITPVLATPETIKPLKQRKGGSHGRTKR